MGIDLIQPTVYNVPERTMKTLTSIADSRAFGGVGNTELADALASATKDNVIDAAELQRIGDALDGTIDGQVSAALVDELVNPDFLPGLTRDFAQDLKNGLTGADNVELRTASVRLPEKLPPTAANPVQVSF